MSDKKTLSYQQLLHLLSLQPWFVSVRFSRRLQGFNRGQLATFPLHSPLCQHLFSASSGLVQRMHVFRFQLQSYAGKAHLIPSI